MLLLQGCESPPIQPPTPAPKPTLQGYTAPTPIRTIRYTDGMMCEEKPSDVGVQCYCRSQWLELSLTAPIEPPMIARNGAS